jgi:hypothetical protein
MGTRPDESLEAAKKTHELSSQLLADCHERGEQPGADLVKLALESVGLVDRTLKSEDNLVKQLKKPEQQFPSWRM